MVQEVGGEVFRVVLNEGMIKLKFLVSDATEE